MAENSKDDVKHAIAKGNAKRDYLLSDEDLKELNHETKDNPINKSYPPMKIFKLSEVKSKAVEVWGSLEKLEDEKTKRKQKKVNVETKNEEEKRKFWDCEEIYEPLKKYMNELKLPVVAKEVPPATKGLLDCDVILCYSDCMNSRPPGAFGRRLFKDFPEVSEVNKSTPYNDRKKMGHFSWCLCDTEIRKHLIVNFYVVHKWSIAAKSRTAIPVLVLDALDLGLTRFTKLLKDTLSKSSNTSRKLEIGTYTPYKVDAEQFKQILLTHFKDVHIFNKLEP